MVRTVLVLAAMDHGHLQTGHHGEAKARSVGLVSRPLLVNHCARVGVLRRCCTPAVRCMQRGPRRPTTAIQATHLPDATRRMAVRLVLCPCRSSFCGGLSERRALPGTLWAVHENGDALI